jgi:hypothetical protein
MIEASPSAYPRGLLALGKKPRTGGEETAGASIPSRTHLPVGSTGMPAPGTVCILSHEGEILVHRHMKAAPEPFLNAVAPYREGLVVAVEWPLHLGPGSPISALKKISPLFWATRAL